MKLLGLFALLALFAFPQAPPDLSGQWVAVAPPTLTGQQLTITQSPAVVTLRFKLREEEYVAEYGLDGKARVAPAKYSPGGRLLLSAKWDDSKLVLIDMSNVPGPLRTQRTLSFDKNGDLVLDLRSPRMSPDIVPEQAHKHSDSIIEPSRVVYRRR